MKWIGVLALLAAVGSGPNVHAGTDIIPAPANVEPRSGVFAIRARARISIPRDPEVARIARYWADLLFRTRGIRLAIAEGAVGDSEPAIVFEPRWNTRAARARSAVDRGAEVANPEATSSAVARSAAIPEFANTELANPGPANPEGYVLEVSPRRITLSASDPRGLLYAAVTLWQFCTTGADSSPDISIPAQKITDSPRFAWRGLMLDSARHYQSPQFILQLIDWMALHKLNVLHWHLTDDQGWRLEIKKYPRLTSVGAWRVPAGAGAASDIDPATGKPRLYGGFYSQEVVRQIVAHAAERNITIVPEIEVPGHATAAIVAYPQLGVLKSPPRAVPSDWGVYPYLYNAEESTFSFLEDVFTEVIGLFPGTYIHVGGDEAVKDEWKASPRIQERMRELGVPDEQALQRYFVQRIEKFLAARGRKLIGWDEILDGGIPARATVMSWRGVEGAVAAASAGHDTVLSPVPTLYLNFRQGDRVEEPPGFGDVVPLERVYRFDPLPAALPVDQRSHVLGLQGNIWTEHIRDDKGLEYMAFPRIAAIAEIGWSPAGSLRWRDFLARLPDQMTRYRLLGIHASDDVFAVNIDAQLEQASQRVHVRLTTQADMGQIRYTLDGSEPTHASPLYAEPLDLPAAGRLRAAAFEGSRPLSSLSSRSLDVLSLQRRFSQQLKTCTDKEVLSLEDDAPLHGKRAVFLVDIQNPCWIFQGADLSRATALTAAVGQVSFNFQLGEDTKSIKLHAPRTPQGELEVRIDSCDGKMIAMLPLAPAVANSAVTELPAVKIARHDGTHDLCFRFTQHTLDPMWVLDWIQLQE